MHMASFIVLELTTLVAIAFAAIHYWARPLHKWLYTSEQIAISFSGGMAITYVFLHLLPELEQGDVSLGRFPIHIVALIGFLLFYGAQRWIWSQTQDDSQELNKRAFWLQMLFISSYNFLLIYSIPEQFEQSIPFAFIYVLAMSLHLLSTDHHLSEHYKHLFDRQGRYVLIAAVVCGLVTDLFAEAANRTFSNTLTALLTGFLMFNIFKEELPDHKETRFVWFLSGVVFYIFLLGGSWLLG